MKLEILDTTVVILASDHNPTILHPSFLESNGIVPKDWQLAEAPICTPLFAMARYSNGIQFIAESIKFQVSQAPPPSPFSNSEAPSLAQKYISKLPHVPYTSIGLNIGAIINCSNPDDLLIKRFLSTGAWNEYDLKLKSLALRFVYPLEKGLVSLMCDPGKVERGSDKLEISGVTIKANYHNDLEGNDRLNQAKDILSKFADRCEHFSMIIRKLFEIED
jgi:hypothetical protein